MTEGLTIAAFDPGKTTGYVLANYTGGKEFDLMDVRAIPWEHRFNEIMYQIEEFGPTYVVVESFKLYPHAAQAQIGQEFPSSQVIGIIGAAMYQYLGDSYVEESLKFQPANVRSSVSVLDVHREMVGSSPHTRDAYRHLRYFVIVNLLRKGSGILTP